MKDLFTAGTLPVPRLLLPFFEFLFPPVCLHCGERITSAETHLCAACRGRIRRVAREEERSVAMKRVLVDQGPCDGLVCAFLFERGGPVQSLVHRVKYGGMTDLGFALGKELGRRLREEGWAVEGVIPVPLHRSRFRERGYNQSEVIAAGVASVAGVPVEAKLLRRRRLTASQTELGSEARGANVAGAFTLRPGREIFLKGKRFALVDDVITTGATIAECACVLRSGGAESVIACAVALAV